MPQKRVVIIAGGDLEDLNFYHNMIGDDDYIICANGGTGHALALGLEPDLVIGDLDSLEPRDREALEEISAEMISYPSEKDKSDLELALDHAVSINPSGIVIIGALGGARFDHAFVNALLLYIPLKKGIPARIVDERQEIILAREEVVINGTVGDCLSLFALTNEVSGIVTTGLKYNLNNKPLRYASTLGLSNELTASEVNINFQSGLLLIIKTSAAVSRATDFSWPGH